MRRSGDFGDQLDLHAGAQRNLRHAERAAGVLAGVAEDLDEQFRGAVGHQVLLRVLQRRIHQAHHLDDALDAAEVAAQVARQRGQQVDGDGARGGLALLGGHVGAELADPGLAVLLGDMARQEHQVAGLRGHHIGCSGGAGGGQFDAQLFQLGLDVLGGGHEGSLSRTVNKQGEVQPATLPPHGGPPAEADHGDHGQGEQHGRRIERLAEQEPAADQRHERLQQLYLADPRDSARGQPRIPEQEADEHGEDRHVGQPEPCIAGCARQRFGLMRCWQPGQGSDHRQQYRQ